jgi:hypothetical protein
MENLRFSGRATSPGLVVGKTFVYRDHLGAHYLSDVLGAMATGGLVGARSAQNESLNSSHQKKN